MLPLETSQSIIRRFKVILSRLFGDSGELDVLLFPNYGISVYSSHLSIIGDLKSFREASFMAFDEVLGCKHLMD